MKDLLFLAHRIPYPPDKGEKIRAWHMLRHLARTHRVHLGCFIDDPADWAHLPVLRRSAPMWPASAWTGGGSACDHCCGCGRGCR